jgi:hypothetical protein
MTDVVKVLLESRNTAAEFSFTEQTLTHPANNDTVATQLLGLTVPTSIALAAYLRPACDRCLA